LAAGSAVVTVAVAVVSLFAFFGSSSVNDIKENERIPTKIIVTK
jgi:hypothetical protein